MTKEVFPLFNEALQLYETICIELQEKSDLPVSVLDSCIKAIIIYSTSLLKYSGRELKESDYNYYISQALNNAVFLAIEGEEGLRLGAPGYPHTKLRFSTRKANRGISLFYIDPNGMNEKDFKKWNEFVKSRFEENELIFVNEIDAI